MYLLAIQRSSLNTKCIKFKHKKFKIFFSSIFILNRTCDSNLSKTLEKIIYNKLNWYVQRFNLLSPNQHGFRKFHSTSYCHVKIETEILESYANKQTMILISLDLQKAYDTVWRHKILKILSKWHING